MKILILGHSGMLGHMVTKYLNNPIDDIFVETAKLCVEHDTDMHSRLEGVVDKDVDYIINCIGAIKPKFNRKNISTEIYTNAIFPRVLADFVDMNNAWGELNGCKVIHLSTDCVFNGLSGQYLEDSPQDCLDEYGKTKSLGEPHNCMVIRTSIIGPELGSRKRSLLEWLIDQSGKNIKGFTDHIWNGVTTLELARAIETIIKDKLYSHGTFHVFSEDISKFDLLSLYSETMNLNINVEPVDTGNPCDRTLRTNYSLNKKLGIMNQRQMAEFLKPYLEARMANRNV